MPDAELLRVLAALGPARILVVGDAMLDRFVAGAVERISPEAPIPVLEERELRETPGGAANVACGLAALGARVALFGRCGADDPGLRLRELLAAAAVDAAALRVREDARTVTKTRFVAAGAQMLRVDRDCRLPADDGELEALSAALERPFDLVVVSDYGQGLVAGASLDLLRASGRPFVADPARGRAPELYAGALVATPNRREAEEALGRVAAPAELAAAWCARSGGPVLVTLGGEGAVLARPGFAVRTLPARRREVFDVTGAGDSALAAVAAALASGRELREACALGMLAGALAVGLPGTGVVDRGALERAAALDADGSSG